MGLLEDLDSASDNEEFEKLSDQEKKQFLFDFLMNRNKPPIIFPKNEFTMISNKKVIEQIKKQTE
jgi:hypothetical protein